MGGQRGRFQAWTKLCGRPVANASSRLAASRLAGELCHCDSAIRGAEFGALAWMACHAPGMAEGQAARYALLQAWRGTVATAAAPCPKRVAHLPAPPLPPRLSMPQGAVRQRSSGRAGESACRCWRPRQLRSQLHFGTTANDWRMEKVWAGRDNTCSFSFGNLLFSGVGERQPAADLMR